MEYVCVVDVALELFDEQAFKTSLASHLDIEEQYISLRVLSGSVRVEATIREPPTITVSEILTSLEPLVNDTSVAASALNVPVLSSSAVETTIPITPASTSNLVGSSSDSGGGGIAIVIVGVAVVIVAGLACWRLRGRKPRLSKLSLVRARKGDKGRGKFGELDKDSITYQMQMVSSATSSSTHDASEPEKTDMRI